MRSSSASTRASSATPCRRAWKRRFSRARQVAVEQGRSWPSRPTRPRTAQPALWQRVAEDAVGAAVRAQQRREHAQQRRLARAVGPEDHERRPAGTLTGDVLAAPPLAVAARRAGELNGRRGASTVAASVAADVRRAPARARGKSCAIAFGLPGRLTISVWPAAARDAAREHPHRRVSARLTARIASAIPGASRSITARVASGVSVVGRQPVPPVVKTKVTPWSHVVVQAVLR